jgi:hypothetical protein
MILKTKAAIQLLFSLDENKLFLSEFTQNLRYPHF